MFLELVQPCLRQSTTPALFMGTFFASFIGAWIFELVPWLFVQDTDSWIPNEGIPTLLAESYAIVQVDLKADDVFEQLQNRRELKLTLDMFEYFQTYSLNYFFSIEILWLFFDFEFFWSMCQQFYYIFLFF